MTYVDDTQPVSWAVPIALGSLVTFLGTGLLTLLGGTSGAAAFASCCCLLPSSFLPFGVFVSFIAWRRDPRLTPGQGATVTFIAVGLGLVFWAGLQSFSIDPDEVTEQARQLLREAEERGSRSEMTKEEREAVAESIGATAPFAPLVLAAAISVLAAFTGMMTVSLLSRRRDGAPPLHTGDPSGAS